MPKDNTDVRICMRASPKPGDGFVRIILTFCVVTWFPADAGRADGMADLESLTSVV
jgi:hypothetical protein